MKRPSARAGHAPVEAHAGDLIAIDPSITCTGFARFVRGALAEVRVYRAVTLAEAVALPAGSISIARPYSYVIELPRAYSATRSKADPNDLIAIAAVAGAWASQAGTRGAVRFVFPAEWKGQTPKSITDGRVRAALTDIERDLIAVYLCQVPAGLRHNAMDAIGIGLFQLGRLRP